MFWNRKKTRLELLREAAMDKAHEAIDMASDVLHQATDVVHDKFDHAPDKFHDLKSSAGDTLGDAVSRLGSAVSKLSARAQSAAGDVSENAHDHAAQARHMLEEKRHHLEKKLVRKSHDAREAVEEHLDRVPRAAETTVIMPDPTQKWVYLGAGILAGVIIGIMLAPSTGRRSRALVRDKVSKGAHMAGDLGDAASRKARDLSNRAEGVAHTVTKRLHGKAGEASDRADDITIADRVRSVMGHLAETHDLERINVDCYQGAVTLRGPVINSATEHALLSAVVKVPGVREVISDLLVDEEDDETFLG